jgi:F5/8 type C domain
MRGHETYSCRQAYRFLLERLRLTTVIWLAARLLLLSFTPASRAQKLQAEDSGRGPLTTIRVHAAKPIKTFDPDRALGTSIDILPEGIVDKVFTPAILKESLSAAWGPISYRQNTELQGAAWHWNPQGTWSDSARQRGYFTGSSEPRDFIHHSYGYPLPHRGNTRGDGRSRSKYSRMTDGDAQSYWKSNPYLTSKFTGEDDWLHPQWVMVDLGATEKVDTLRIDWAEPYARSYQVQYWSGGKDPLTSPTAGIWIAFPQGIIGVGRGGTETLHLSAEPLPAKYIRIWMTQSSNTSGAHDSDDPRASAGYAIRELYAGTMTSNGEFVDLIKHVPDAGQTVISASSVDPWHGASDFDPQAGDQTGFDLFYSSGITNKLPAMIPIALLYSTPDDGAAEIAYIEKRGYPISYVEMGEEPDGQKMLPEDYGALYLQFAAALHRVDPKLKLGGPVFEGVNEDIKVWPDSRGRVSWLGRFIDYLEAHGRLPDLSFVSFEHYPFAPCDVTWSDLYREPELTEGILKIWRADGVPANVPLMNTESNLSWGLTQPMSDIFAALWLADSVGSFLTAGGDVYYHSPIQPEPLRSGCRGWSTYGNFVADENLTIHAHTSQYYASRLINLEWVRHGAGGHTLFPASTDLKDGAGHTLITAYPVQQRDGNWSVMVINKDQSNAHQVRVVFDDGSGAAKSFVGPITVVSFGSDQYVWHSEGAKSHPDPNEPPITKTVQGGSNVSFTLQRASVTILRGKT